MEKTTILKKLFGQKNKDYTYVTLFFLIFSFFVYFIIRPNLISVFEANKKIEDLKKINEDYDNQIEKIIEVQAILETYREDLVYLDESIAKKPNINKVLDDIYSSAEQNKIKFEKVNVSDVDLKEKMSEPKLKLFTISLGSDATFEGMLLFLKQLYQQRRLKYIPVLSLDYAVDEASNSGRLKLQFNLEGYYL